MARGNWLGAGLVSAVLAAGFAGACGSSGDEAAGPAQGGSAGSAGSGGSGFDLDSSIDGQSALSIAPMNPTLMVTTGQPVPTQQFQALMNGSAVNALWLVDRAEIGGIDSNGLFTPTGKVAGSANVEATVGAQKVSTSITVQIQTVQNGGDPGDAGPGSGGYLGVGGEGVGGAVDPTLLGVLTGTPSTDPALKWLYPYDKTVFPLGILAPLLQWTPNTGAVADGVYIHLTTTNYDYKGYFGRPGPLAAGTPFVRHPIPQDAWEAATKSAAGGQLTAEVVVAAGGAAYGPISETWKIARGVLKGTVYYQSYATKLAKNYGGAIGGDGMFGGATLAIKPGATEPTLVAGKSGGHNDCRVCHSVSADGSRMIVQHGDAYSVSSSYDLLNGYTESGYPGSSNGKLGWIGMTPDGALGLMNASPIPGGANSGNSELFDMASGNAVPTTGLSSFVTQAGMPAFSPDGTKVAFNFYAGPGDAASGAGDGKKLVVMDFDRASSTFTNPKVVYTGGDPPGWPTFMPTGDALVFQTEPPGSGGWFETRSGGKGELWWVDLASANATRMEQVNGKSAGALYLPAGPGNHADDSQYSYEPTVSPIPSGGYAWVVFMSRRQYGNVATIDPWWSDPRDHDLTATPTPKKLWVAAIDLNAPAGTDPSHPAFYLPGQEILAANSRGYWVVDPCKPDGSMCSSGDECCGGFCQQDPKTGALSCGNKTNDCSMEFDKCSSDADCCTSNLKCINQVCAFVVPQ